jgi:hypothetical protein
MTHSKREAALSRFAAKLGWSELRRYQHSGVPSSVLTTWYESGESQGLRSDYFFQVNECPTGQEITYCGAVYAMRYRICTGWHAFELSCTEGEMMEEALRLDGWLHKRWFESRELRRDFKRSHPECANYTWTKIREKGPPYEQQKFVG